MNGVVQRAYKSILFTEREQSLFRLSEEVVEWGQSNAVQSDWCWSQCVCVCVWGGGGEGVRVQWYVV